MEFRQKEFRHLNFDNVQTVVEFKHVSKFQKNLENVVEILMELRPSVDEVEGEGESVGVSEGLVLTCTHEPTLPHAHPLPLSQSHKNFENCPNSIILSKNLLEIRQSCPNSTTISTCFKILLQFGHCRNSDGEILFVEIPQNRRKGLHSFSNKKSLYNSFWTGNTYHEWLAQKLLCVM